MYLRFTFLCISWLALMGQINAQAKYSNEFLNIGVGARAQGMANAHIASVDNLMAAYWNPAGLTRIKAPFQVSAMHAEWFAGIANYDYVGLAKPLGRDNDATLSLGIIRLGIDQIPYTFNLIEPDGSINYDNVSEFSAADYGILLSYAQRLKNRKWSVGGTAKIINRVVGRFGKSWGFGLDLGVQYEHKKWIFALSGRDITTTFNAWSFTFDEEEKLIFEQTGNIIPLNSIEVTRPRIILGAARTFQFGEKYSLLAEANLDFTTDGQRNVLVSSENFNMDPRFGLELGYSQFLYFRGGIGNIQRSLDDIDGTSTITTFQPNFGLGIRLGRVTIDYALTDIGNVSQALYSLVFSLVVDFKRKTRTE